jgi:hypothetical protein
MKHIIPRKHTSIFNSKHKFKKIGGNRSSNFGKYSDPEERAKIEKDKRLYVAKQKGYPDGLRFLYVTELIPNLVNFCLGKGDLDPSLLKEEKRKNNPLLLKLLAVCRAIRSKPDLYQNIQIRNFLYGKKGSDIPPFDQRHLTQPLLSESQKIANPDDVLGK